MGIIKPFHPSSTGMEWSFHPSSTGMEWFLSSVPGDGLQNPLCFFCITGNVILNHGLKIMCVQIILVYTLP